MDSITGGSDALAEVSIKVEDKNGNVVSARKAGEDVVVVSVQAMMDAINKAMLGKVLYSKTNFLVIYLFVIVYDIGLP